MKLHEDMNRREDTMYTCKHDKTNGHVQTHLHVSYYFVSYSEFYELVTVYLICGYQLICVHQWSINYSAIIMYTDDIQTYPPHNVIHGRSDIVFTIWESSKVLSTVQISFLAIVSFDSIKSLQYFFVFNSLY